MDTRLSETAPAGDVISQAVLITDDPLFLDLSSLSDDNNPLHIAVMAGQVEFVREILRQKPELAWDRNRDGFTPLHIASAKGDVVMAKEILLKLGDRACLLKGKEGRIPLHYAATKGRVQVMEELLSAWPDSVEEVTARGETAAHLAAKNCQFDAFLVLVEHLKGLNKEAVLNWKDSQGNTVLHIAAAREDYAVIKSMVSGFMDEGLIQVNALNDVGLTALDMLFLPAKEARDMEIVDILMKYGAARATGSRETRSDTALPPAQSDDHGGQELGSLDEASVGLKLFEYFKFDKDRDSPGEVRSALLVIAALIVTATYSAALQPPGGLWQDNSGSHRAGSSVLGTSKPTAYLIFLVSNSFGFCVSAQMLEVLTAGFPMKMELRTALFALGFSYSTMVVNVSPNTFIQFFYVGISIVMPILVWIMACRYKVLKTICSFRLLNNGATVR
ncbi:hypothetical protein MLD38_038540 [Melastoma candidum]|uniref:Uncharacterized protein n=1 Tax=Melastoma candidum TaxID=119954 RepID=A0ACB9L034_9MYRT|nr:hypothetical protein MLD38_038540 [Melastoma candidum]